MNFRKSNLVCLLWLIFTGLSTTSGDSLPMTARQSGDQTDPGRAAKNAVDGNSSTCNLAAEDKESNRDSSFGWLQIDLGNPFLVISVTLTKSSDYRYLENIVILVSNSNRTDNVRSSDICAQFNNASAFSAGTPITFTCPGPLLGRYVTLKRQGGYRHDAISICEVSITRFTTDILSSSTSSTVTSTSRSTTTTNVKSSKSISIAITKVSSLTSRPTSSTTIPVIESTSSANDTLSDRSTNEVNSVAIICPVVILGVLVILIVSGVFLYLYRRKRHVNVFKKFSLKAEKKPNTKPESDVCIGSKPKPPVKPKTQSNLHRPIKADEIIAYVERMKIGDALKKEFDKLPQENLGQVEVGKRSENLTKNRFKNILPYDHTIVTLAMAQSDEENTGYINANYITGYKNGFVEKMYIATQGPLVDTVNDFWRMIWQENSDLIIMTTPLNELGKIKCEQYWPPKLQEMKIFGNLSVQLTKEDIFTNHVYREMEIHEEDKRTGGQRRTVRQMHFLMWEDKQKPNDFLPVLAFRNKIRDLLHVSSQPIVIHCSAGIGRTGTFIALDTLLEQLKRDGQISFFKCVEDLRKQRMLMVQTWKQYAFLHEAVADHFQTENTSIPRSSFPDRYKALITKTPNGSKLKQQYDLLDKLRAQTGDRESAGNRPENINKNRNKNIVAYDDSRVFLRVTNGDSNNYVNAIYAQGLRSKKAFVLSQLPLKDTIVDFWRLLWDHELKNVLLLDDVESNEELCPKFWPDEGQSETYGPFTVTTTTVTEKFSSILQREFSVKNTSQKTGGTLTVRQYQVKGWLRDSPVPASPSLILPIISELLTNRSTGSGESIVFQCIDGTVKSGLMATAMYVAEMIRGGDSVDIFYACRIVSLNRPQIIKSAEQYTFLHEFASAFINYSGKADASLHANGQAAFVYSIGNESEYINCRSSVI